MTVTPIRARLHGILPPVVTPFNRRGDIDQGAFRANLERSTGIGLAGVVVAGSSGEAPYLNERERLRLTELARRSLGPPELVITGTGLESTRDTIRLSREAIARGADAVLVVTPNYYKSSMDRPALLAYYRSVADAVSRPVLIYSIPQFTGIRVPAEVIAELSHHPNIAGVKDSSGDLVLARRILRRVRPGFRVFVGAASILLDALRAGAAGGILAQADFAPELCVALYEAFRQGSIERAREFQSQLEPLVTHVNRPYGVAGIKAAMDLSGYRGGAPRPPLLPAGPAARRAIARALKQVRDGLAF
jgi:4-hydroxy-2-oxoglutarate aldolase